MMERLLVQSSYKYPLLSTLFLQLPQKSAPFTSSRSTPWLDDITHRQSAQWRSPKVCPSSWAASFTRRSRCSSSRPGMPVELFLQPRRRDYRAVAIQLRFPKYEGEHRNVEIARRDAQNPRVQVGDPLQALQDRRRIVLMPPLIQCEGDVERLRPDAARRVERARQGGRQMFQHHKARLHRPGPVG